MTDSETEITSLIFERLPDFLDIEVMLSVIRLSLGMGLMPSPPAYSTPKSHREEEEETVKAAPSYASKHNHLNRCLAEESLIFSMTRVLLLLCLQQYHM